FLPCFAAARQGSASAGALPYWAAAKRKHQGDPMNQSDELPAGMPISRRHLLRGLAVAGAASALAGLSAEAAPAAGAKAALKGRIKQSIVFWCFNNFGKKWDVDKTCQVACDLGYVSVELVDPAQWAVLKKHKLICAIAPNGMPGAPFVKGFNNPRYHDEV